MGIPAMGSSIAGARHSLELTDYLRHATATSFRASPEDNWGATYLSCAAGLTPGTALWIGHFRARLQPGYTATARSETVQVPRYATAGIHGASPVSSGT